MRKNFTFLALMCISVTLSAQMSESFSDGNFSIDPVWIGNTGDWQIVASSDVAGDAAGSNTLRLAVPEGSGSTWLSTRLSGSWGPAQSWALFVGRRTQAYTAANHTFIWLWASESDLLSPTIDGYRIRIGDDGGGDEIILQKVTDGVPSVIITGAALTNGLTDIGFLLRVTRNVSGNWELFTSTLPVANGTGAVATDVPIAMNSGISHGSAIDNTYSSFDNGHFGFANVYASGTAARAAQEFDQIIISFLSEALPLKLSYFNANYERPITRLVWKAEEEINVDVFEIERSNDGSRFETIASIDAVNAGTYFYNDQYIPVRNTFYRLRIRDRDASYIFSDVVRVNAKPVTTIRVMNNPVRLALILEHPPSPAGTRALLHDMTGRLIRQFTITESASITSLDVSSMPPGMYCVTLTGKTHQETLKIVKVN